MNLEKLANILGAETVKKIYEDGASQPVQEASKALTDLIKALRLFTAPIQFLAAYQDRLSKFLDKVRQNVPEDRQIEAPPSISGPILEKLKYLEENNYLTDLYLELLSRAIDKERISEAHPAFFSIIEQLSPDEALILAELKKGELLYNYTRDLNDTKTLFLPSVPTDTPPIFNNLALPEHFSMYAEHLNKLNLVYWSILKEDMVWNDPETQKNQKGVFIRSKIYLSRFGELFVKACVPNTIIVIR